VHCKQSSLFEGSQDSQDLIPRRGKIFLFSAVSRLALRPTKSPIQWLQGAIFPDVKWQSAEVKNGEAALPLPICLHDIVDRATLPLHIIRR
jgi:hypothetical protein